VIGGYSVLGGITSLESVLDRHAVDAILITTTLPPDTQSRLADIAAIRGIAVTRMDMCETRLTAPRPDPAG